MAKQHGKSDFLELELLDHVLGNAAYSAPATVHFAWFTALTGEAGGGTEATGGGYARVAVTNNATNFPAAASGSLSAASAKPRKPDQQHAKRSNQRWQHARQPRPDPRQESPRKPGQHARRFGLR